MKTQRIGMSQFLLPLFLSSLVIATGADLADLARPITGNTFKGDIDHGTGDDYSSGMTDYDGNNSQNGADTPSQPNSPNPKGSKTPDDDDSQNGDDTPSQPNNNPNPKGSKTPDDDSQNGDDMPSQPKNDTPSQPKNSPNPKVFKTPYENGDDTPSQPKDYAARQIPPPLRSPPSPQKTKSGDQPTDSMHPTPPQDPSSSSQVPTTSIPPPGRNIKQEFLDCHNSARQSNHLPPFTWDPKVEAYARIYAKKRASIDCEMIHSESPYGENIYWGSGVEWRPQDAVTCWMDEVKDYDPKGNKCIGGRMCRHYTQIVWRASTRLGCAMEICKTKDGGVYTVCSYDPPGNYDGIKPFEST